MKKYRYKGKVYHSSSALWREHKQGASLTTFKRRLASGFSIKNALKPAKKAKEHIYKNRTYKVLSKLFKEHASEGVSKNTFDSRIKAKWSLEAALKTPVNEITKNRVYKIDGQTLATLKEVSDHYELKYQMLATKKISRLE